MLFLLKMINVKVTLAIWQIFLFIFILSGAFTYIRCKRLINDKSNLKERIIYQEVIVEKEKYITNVSFKYIQKELEDFYDQKIPESDIAKLNNLISDIIDY